MTKCSSTLRLLAAASVVASALYGIALPAHAADQAEVQPAGPAWLQKAERKIDKGAKPVTRAIGKAGAKVGHATERGAHAVKRGSDKMGAKMHEKLPQGHKPPDVRGKIDQQAN
ncbi:MAG: hypothetical protein OJF60_001567 [Burkholderiaceae bacterium]|jgi:type IV secretory pathway TrbL component|nr:MAG: hypothetical protein OJF60_001567 [Burkholderiaceae bacterium]